MTALHELAHAVFNLTDVTTSAGLLGATLPDELNSRVNTIMSYSTIPGAGPGDDASSTFGSFSVYPSTPMVLDILAAQLIYGPNLSFNSGDDAYVFNASQTYFETVWDAAGTDTFDASALATNVSLDLRDGQMSNVGSVVTAYHQGQQTQISRTVGIAYGAVIENAVGGSGNDTIQGNDAANTLTGNNGNDTIYGGGGGDVLIGGSGVDRLFGEDGDDTIFYDASDDLANVQGGNGTDTLVFTSGSAPSSFALAARGFEGAEGRFTDTGAQPWATRTDYYNTSWQLYQSILTNDDATSQQTTFDIANGQPWSQAITYRNAAGQTTLQSVLNDDNSSQANYFDPTNVQSWSQANTYYNTAGQTTHQSILNDDNTSRTTYYDPTNVQPWASADTFYNTAGQTTLQSVANDNGTTQAQYWDTTNAYNWSTVIHYYNAGGVRTLTTGVYDAGGTFSY